MVSIRRVNRALLMALVVPFVGSAHRSRPRPTSLFNGRDLSGWHVDVPAADTSPRLRSPFLVRNGMLVTLGEPRGHLITDSSYSNYRLEVEYRFPGAPGNAGGTLGTHRRQPRAVRVPETDRVRPRGKVARPLSF